MPRQILDMGVIAWRVRSPIHSMWPEVQYQSPVVESTRVNACS